MRRFWIAAALSLALTGGLAAQDTAHRAVIEAQIAAFLADDFDAAFDFASPGIRAIFGTADRFGQMVTQGYPMVHRPAGLRFLQQTERAGALVQRVMITDLEGRLHILEYEMLPAGGSFVINGVRLVPGQGAGA